MTERATLLGADGVAPEAVAAAALTAARRFAAGATMWCVAPEWPWHARHVAVEFVHPVVVGTRALPAVAVEAAGSVRHLRTVARPGDLLVTIGSGTEPLLSDLLRRAATWGLVRIAIGAGPPMATDLFEHAIWSIEAEPGLAARSGLFVLSYHLLWELTHVVFEHPGLLRVEAGLEPDRCVTCSDEALLGEVRTVGDDGRLDVVVDGRRQLVDGGLLERQAVGDLVLVHAGVAIDRLTDEGEVAK